MNKKNFAPTPISSVNLLTEMIKLHATDRLEEFRRFTCEIESKFNTDKNDLHESCIKAAEGISDEEAMEIQRYFSDEHYMIEEIYIGMYRKSTLVSIYSFVENSLNDLCKHLNKKNSYPITLDDLKGEGIERAKSYLEKLAKVDFQVLNGEWCHLQDLNKIRNCIVHCEGDIKSLKSDSKIKNIVAQNPSLSLKNERNLSIEREYVDFCITKTETFLEKLYQEVFAD